MAFPSQSLYFMPERFGAYAQAVGLPGGIDIRQHYPVGQGQRPGDLFQKGLRAGKGMGLENAPEPFVWVIARGR